MIARVLAHIGATVRYHYIMYKAVAQSVLLYDSESGVVTREMLKFLEGFHNWADRRIMGMMATHGAGREWEYPLVLAALEAVGLQIIMEYSSRRQVIMAEILACQPI